MALISQYHKVANDLINSLETIQSTIWAVMTWQLSNLADKVVRKHNHYRSDECEKHNQS